ncbi:hypothetical protein SAMN04487881_0392 [Marinobacter sp. es.048]|uniref:ankyrin repeat domain-containing protein n=1 Tax=Marinobacter sp. es.048 TaxID=1761795 RepID=UPI000B587A65|nr:ankyrin repeat domain-containing protein [Marinobacter sp. es.048]SNC61116.1 hypothetical protein SAMN04487881_0392 [Marinobacter sp. es.048]
MSQQKPGKPQQPANQKDEDAVAFAQGIFELARNGGAGPLSVMLSAGVPANMRTSEGDSLLMLASRNGHSETVQLLLENGADPEARNDHGETALSLASSEDIRSLINDWEK